MAVTLVTGLPGSGKTLFALSRVKALAEREDRLVYYFGIPDLKLPWVPLVDPLKWFELPGGSIVVIDEAQKVFRVRASAAAVPPHVSAFETHRHLGIDVFLVTQHPSLIDQHVRRLSSSHFHLVRKFGMRYSTLHEFYEVRDQPDKNRHGALVSQWAFPDELFSVYKSADLHTVKRKLPGRVIFAALAPLVVLALLVGLYFFFGDRLSEYRASDSKNSSVRASSSVGGSSARVVPDIDDYVRSRAPVVPGLGFTAPVYSDVVRPVVAPIPVICVSSSSRCLCATEQGTHLSDMPEETCRSIVERGFFVDHERRSAAGGSGGERQRPTEQPPGQGVGTVAPSPLDSSAVGSPPAASSTVAGVAPVSGEGAGVQQRVFKGSPHKAP